jgi:hypothetical protein
MSAKSDRRKQMATLRAQRKESQHRPGDESKYARKVAYCLAHHVDPLSVPEPKPWKT